MMTLAGCASAPGLIPDTSKPKILISDACEKLPGRVALPVIKKGDDARMQLGRHRSGLKKANNQLDAKNQCMKNMRERFAKGG